MSSASFQKLFCGSCSTFIWSFNKFVGEKVVFLSYSSSILGPPLVESSFPTSCWIIQSPINLPLHITHSANSPGLGLLGSRHWEKVRSATVLYKNNTCDGGGGVWAGFGSEIFQTTTHARKCLWKPNSEFRIKDHQWRKSHFVQKWLGPFVTSLLSHLLQVTLKIAWSQTKC